jgi:hypothetical protein
MISWLNHQLPNVIIADGNDDIAWYLTKTVAKEGYDIVKVRVSTFV